MNAVGNAACLYRPPAPKMDIPGSYNCPPIKRASGKCQKELN